MLLKIIHPPAKIILSLILVSFVDGAPIKSRVEGCLGGGGERQLFSLGRMFVLCRGWRCSPGAGMVLAPSGHPESATQGKATG